MFPRINIKLQLTSPPFQVKEPAPSPEMAGFLSVLSCCLYLANKSQGIVTLLVPDDAVSAAKNHKNCNAPNNYTGL